MKLGKQIVILLILLSFTISALAQQSPSRDFSKETARASQDWIKDAVIYEIFPRQYSQKGDFNSITNDLDRLKNLGVTVLWLMPVHPIGQEKKKGTIGSPYAVRDYYAINPDYGTKEDLKRLIAEARKRGLKVIIDIVANHTAWDSVMMKNPAFYTRNEKGEIISPVPDWADVADLNYENAELRKYIIEMLKFWVREYDLDGFRCDVAGFVPTDFWEEARREVDKIKADTIWLAEWHEPDLLVNAFNLDYSWSMHSALDEVLHGKKQAKFIRETWETEKAKFPKNSLHLRFSDNHDERRAIARFGEGGALAAQALAFTIDGVPLVYNGMEVGDTTESGFPALFEKMPIFWDVKVRRPEFVKFYDEMIKLRKNHTALRRGETVWLINNNDQRVLSFVRRDENEEITVVINMSNQPATVILKETGKATRPQLIQEVTPKLSDKAESAEINFQSLPLKAWEFRIFKIGVNPALKPVLKRRNESN